VKRLSQMKIAIRLNIKNRNDLENAYFSTVVVSNVSCLTAFSVSLSAICNRDFFFLDFFVFLYKQEGNTVNFF